MQSTATQHSKKGKKKQPKKETNEKNKTKQNKADINITQMMVGK